MKKFSIALLGAVSLVFLVACGGGGGGGATTKAKNNPGGSSKQIFDSSGKIQLSSGTYKGGAFSAQGPGFNTDTNLKVDSGNIEEKKLVDYKGATAAADQDLPPSPPVLSR